MNTTLALLLPGSAPSLSSRLSTAFTFGSTLPFSSSVLSRFTPPHPPSSSAALPRAPRSLLSCRRLCLPAQRWILGWSRVISSAEFTVPPSQTDACPLSGAPDVPKTGFDGRPAAWDPDRGIILHLPLSSSLPCSTFEWFAVFPRRKGTPGGFFLPSQSFQTGTSLSSGASSLSFRWKNSLLHPPSTHYKV